MNGFNRRTSVESSVETHACARLRLCRAEHAVDWLWTAPASLAVDLEQLDDEAAA